MADTKIVIKNNKLKLKKRTQVASRTRRGAFGMILGALLPVVLDMLGVSIPAEVLGQVIEHLPAVVEVASTIVFGVIGMWSGHPEDPRDIEGLEVVS